MDAFTARTARAILVLTAAVISVTTASASAAANVAPPSVPDVPASQYAEVPIDEQYAAELHVDVTVARTHIGRATRTYVPRPHALRTAALVVGIGFAVTTESSCTATAEPAAVPIPSNIATYQTTEPAGDGALIAARVTATNPCIVVTDETGTEYFPVFPTNVLDITDSRASYAGVLIEEGAELALPGGATSSEPDFASIPAGCVGDFWIVSGAEVSEPMTGA